MKNKNVMTKLRNKIVLYFSIVVFAVEVIESVIDSFWDHIIVPRIYINGDYNGIDFYSSIYIGVSLLIFVIGGIVFYKLTKKAVQSASRHQVQEQNLIYTAITHDLKTPITSVQGFSGALSEGRIHDDEKQEVYDIIYKKSKTMNELVNTLFEYSRFGTEEYSLQKIKTDICVIVRDIVAENYCDFEEHKVKIDIDIPEEPIVCSVDSISLKRAISNLIVNSYKHNPGGTNVLVSVKKHGSGCIITVADSGNPIPSDMNIFEPFVTENSARTVGHGTGLGLAITKRIIDKHEGRIILETDIENYTKAFVTELP